MRAAVGVILALGATLGAASCANDPPHELVLCVTTDLAAPNEIDTLDITVWSNGLFRGTESHPAPGASTFPATLSLIGGNVGTSIDLRIVGKKGGAEGALVVLRDVTTKVADGVVGFGVALEKACKGITCNTGFTCIAGVCKSKTIGEEYLRPSPSAEACENFDPDRARPNGSACQVQTDCPKLPTAPPDCAVADCIHGNCTYFSVDKDGDGHRSTNCTATNGIPVTLGDDCDDANPALFPGQTVTCNEMPNGTPIAFPRGTPVGECKSGAKTCQPDGTLGPCQGTVGPSTELCAGDTKDEDCDGDPLNGCACSGTQTRSCGPSAIGICKPGTSACQNGTWGPCVGSVNPGLRDCGTSADNNCDGKSDNSVDAQCTCPLNQTVTCGTHPGLDGIGPCKSGTQTCTYSGSVSASAYSLCSGSVGPTNDTCDSNSPDNDCDGIHGNGPGCTKTIYVSTYIGGWTCGYNDPIDVFLSTSATPYPGYTSYAQFQVFVASGTDNKTPLFQCSDYGGHHSTSLGGSPSCTSGAPPTLLGYVSSNAPSPLKGWLQLQYYTYAYGFGYLPSNLCCAGKCGSVGYYTLQ